MENRRKSEDNEMQLKTGRQAWKISKKRFSQTVRRPISQCENFADSFRNAKIHQPKFAMRKFRNAKFRNAKCHFAMPKSISQCQFQISQCQFQFRNAKISQCEISQCQIPFRNANFKFALPIPISQCENFAMRNFAMPKPISHCENHCLCEIQFRKPFRIAKFTLRNFQALSSFVINAEPPSIFGVLLF